MPPEVRQRPGAAKRNEAGIARNNGDRCRTMLARIIRPPHRGASNPGERMPPPAHDYFEANLPGATQSVRISCLHEAKVFARRWVIRDKDPALKALLRQMEKANSFATGDSAVAQFKLALARRGMLVGNSAAADDPPRAR